MNKFLQAFSGELQQDGWTVGWAGGWTDAQARFQSPPSFGEDNHPDLPTAVSNMLSSSSPRKMLGKHRSDTGKDLVRNHCDLPTAVSNMLSSSKPRKTLARMSFRELRMVANFSLHPAMMWGECASMCY